jgi:hypothetical protein
VINSKLTIDEGHLISFQVTSLPPGRLFKQLGLQFLAAFVVPKYD